jgi:hypothetical protein
VIPYDVTDANRGQDWSLVVNLGAGVPDPGSILTWTLLTTLRTNWAPLGTIVTTSTPVITNPEVFGPPPLLLPLRQFTCFFPALDLLLPDAPTIALLVQANPGIVLSPWTYYWDTWRVDAGSQYPLIGGKFIINQVARA